ncbi:MAG: hypothetical protein L0I76_31165, partial [Pseudonocardia sp.]|nr:hypothetical protein [Pseudonocardia sp.]
MDSMYQAVLDQIRAERAGTAERNEPPDALGTVTGIPDRADQVRREYARALAAAAQIDVAKRGTDARDKAIEKARAAAEEGLAELRGEVDQSTAHAAKWIGEQGKGRDATEQLLAETRQGRAWARTAPLLDAGRDAVGLVAAARQAGDHDTLSAMRAELPSYAAARPESAERLRALGDDVPALLGEIDQALAETLPDDRGERTALRTRLAMDDAAANAGSALDSTAKAVETYGDRPDVLRHALRTLDVEENG